MTRPLSTEAPRQSLEHAATFGHAETIASVSLPVPVLDAASVARAFGDALRMSWRDRDGLLSATVGATETLRARGPRRFSEVRSRAASLYRRIAGRQPRLLGGFSFEPGGASGAAWSGFGDARFELPRALYESHGDSAELTVFFTNPLNPSRRRNALHELASRAETLSRVTTASPLTSSAPALADTHEPDSARQHYMDLVARARDLCRTDDFAKIVVARSARVELGHELDLGQLLASLDDAYADCYLFTVAGDDNVLVAASPERLVSVRGQVVETAALAGTVALDRADDLLSDAKLQLEHKLTVDAIADALARSGCEGVRVAARPTLRRLRHLVHLETTIAATRHANAHIFDIAAALHPTPAVAGIPTTSACRFVRDNETEARGWYAGLVGWCDASGDGELAVALRAGLISGDAITLYAGAGVVGTSDPATEWEETRLKIAALRSRLVGK